MCAAAQTANRGQEGGGAGHAGRGRNAARWLSSLRALLLCWLPAALLHWRHAQRALASELSSGMPDDHDTALHSTRVQPIRPINLARAGADGPEPRRQVHLHCAFEAFPQSSFGFREIPTLCFGNRGSQKNPGTPTAIHAGRSARPWRTSDAHAGSGREVTAREGHGTRLRLASSLRRRFSALVLHWPQLSLCRHWFSIPALACSRPSSERLAGGWACLRARRRLGRL